MDNLKIVSLNTRGLRDSIKRRRVYRFIKKHKADIALLQETHCENKLEHLWSSEFGNKIIYSNGTNRSCGVAICVSKKVVNYVHEIRRDIHGRYVIIKFKKQGYTYCIANTYAPMKTTRNSLKPYFKKLRTWIVYIT